MIKTFLIFIFFLLFIFNVQGQNLVPNGDFEQYSGCPNGPGQIDSALFWMNPAISPGSGGSPDYFNQCSPSVLFGVPNNFQGYQPAHSTFAYAGIVLWESILLFREYVEVPLISALVSNTCYHFEMYISLSNISNYATSDLGVYFSDTAITGISNYLPLPFTPQIINSSGYITDTLNWLLVTGNYVAAGGESYLIIGNFMNDVNTNTLLINANGNFPGSYVYIDDVSLTPCTSIEEQNIPNFENLEYLIYPNPVKDELFINCHSFAGKKEIIISDILGKEIYSDQFMTSDFRLPTFGFQSGIYFVEIIPIESGGKNILRKKFLKE